MQKASKMAALSCALTLAAGSIFFPLSFVCVKNVFLYLFSQNLTEAIINNFSGKFVSTMQAVVTTCVGYTIISSCHDVMNDRHWLTNTYALFVFPYFFYDTWAMYQTHLLTYPFLFQKKTWTSIAHFVRCNIIMMFHHIVLPFIYGSAMLGRGGRGDFFVGAFYMIEIAIPFICLWRVLMLLDLKEQLYVKLAAVLMVVTFLVSRILVFPYLYWSYAVYANLSVWHAMGSIPIKCNIGCAILLLPQIFWFGLMIKGFFKVFIRNESVSSCSYDNLGDSVVKND